MKAERKEQKEESKIEDQRNLVITSLKLWKLVNQVNE